MTSDFWFDVLKALVGTAVGAGLAFASNFLILHLQRQQDRYAAAVTAMELLRTQVEDYLNFRKEFLDELGERRQTEGGDGVPEWAVARPTAFYFFDSLTFDYPSLAFLLNHGNHDALARLRCAERRYHELANLSREYNSVAQRKHERMPERVPLGGVKIANMEEVTGPEIAGQLESMIGAIRRHLESDEMDYLAAKTVLRDATAEAFPKRPKLSLKQPVAK